MIGPGEEHLFDFIFHPKEIGEFRSTVTVEIEWLDRIPKVDPNPDPRREAKTETVLYLVGQSEKADITCHPDYLLIDNVLKKSWGEDRFKLINNGNSVACILLECLPRAVASQVGPVEFIPDQVILPPHESTVVTIRCQGEYVGLQTLKIAYTVYTSQDFNVESTGEQIFLLALDFVCTFPVLEIVDIRYKTLCKWLPKLSVWTMLMINKLNEQLKKTFIQKDQKCYMKFPEDTDEAPYFVVQLLVKNVSSVPVRLEVGYIKTCPCNDDRLTQRRGSKFSYKTCNHPQEFSITPSLKFIKPCDHTIVELKAKYNYNVHNYFRVHWKIKPADVDEPDLTSSLTLYIQRRTLSPSSFGLDLYLPGPQKEFCYNLEPVYLGDSNNYVQIIWMYNNSQKDIQYECEWEEGENSVFQVFNPNARVTAVERHPLLIMFRPYEFITYKATLLIITVDPEVRLRVTLTGKGSVMKEAGLSHILSKKMPLSNLFPSDSPFFLQAELSVSHICLEPLPTHSFTQKVFFLKNNTSDNLEYDWRRTLIWGIVHISVYPQHGYLAPGQLIACHLLIRTLRFPCKANVAIECIVRNLKETGVHYETKKYLPKVARTFDACFTLVNKGEINNLMHYKPPRLGIKVGSPPLNTYLCLGISLITYSNEFKDLMFPSIDFQHKLFPARKLDTFDRVEDFELNEFESNIIIRVLKRALNEVFRDTNFLVAINSESKVFRYNEMLELSEESNEPELQSMHMASIISNILYKNFMNLFALDCAPALYDVIQRQIDRSKKLCLNNIYFRDLIVQEIDQMTHTGAPAFTARPSEAVTMGAIREYSGFLGQEDVQHGDFYTPL